MQVGINRSGIKELQLKLQCTTYLNIGKERKELVGQKVAPTVGLEPTISPLGGERLIH